MVSGVKTLHQIDRSIQQARYDVGKASELPSRISKALIELRAKQAHALGQIAKLRLDLIADGGQVLSRKGDDLGYVDRQAAKLLTAHAEQESRLSARADQSAAKITALEAERRALETSVAKAIKDYDAAAVACQKALVKDPGYIALLTAAEQAERTLERAEQKRDLAIQDEHDKGEPYRTDPFFAYLQQRSFGQKEARGWFLTRALDHWVARKIDYQTAAVNYRRLQDIPRRLQGHVEALDLKAIAARQALKSAEETLLIQRGVEALRKASILAQTHLEKCDAKLDAAEAEHQALRAELSGVTAGQSGPYREALSLLTETLERRDLPSLKVLAAQTRSRVDDTAVRDLAQLRETGADLEADQFEASKLLDKYRKGLAELEAVRRQFKSRRYDAPYSQFPSGSDMIGALIGQVLAGMVSGSDLWRQIERAQKTIARGTDIDFGGVDWEEAMRLPRSTRRRGRSRNSGIDMGDIFGSSSGRSGGWGATRSPRRRAPRTRMPKISKPRSGRGGGFKTGGGF